MDERWRPSRTGCMFTGGATGGQPQATASLNMVYNHAQVEADLRIGERLRTERTRMGYSIARLADVAGVSKTYLIRLENAPDSNPSLETLQRLAEALDLTIADLLGRKPVRLDPGALEVPSSLRRFADDQGLSEREVEMLASIRWRHGEQPRTPERWAFIYQSLQASKHFDDRK